MYVVRYKLIILKIVEEAVESPSSIVKIESFSFKEFVEASNHSLARCSIVCERTEHINLKPFSLCCEISHHRHTAYVNLSHSRIR